MTTRSALVMCRADPERTARPRHMVGWLADEFRVSVLAPAAAADPRVTSIRLPDLPLVQSPRPIRVFRLATRRYRPLLWNEQMVRLAAELSQQRFDLVVSHDLELLPLACAVRGSAPLVLDARDYYPRHFEDRPTWRLLYQPFNRRLCRRYLPQCDRVLTVSEGLANAFESDYGVLPTVLLSLPQRFDLEPSPTEPDRVRMIHHGAANPSRRIETMIRLLDHLDRRFTLDLLLLPVDPPYLRWLHDQADRRGSVRILDPIAHHQLVPYTNRFDVGLFLCPPTTFNLRHALPNKLFEFIQARLAVAIGPSPDMAAVVERHGCGIVAEDFTTETMASRLQILTSDEIDQLKARAHVAANQLHAGTNREKVRELVGELLADE